MYWDEDEDGWCLPHEWRYWIGPEVLTTAQAARAFSLQPSTIRQWVHRGHLVPVYHRGRSLVFESRAVYLASIATAERNIQPGGPLRRDECREHDMNIPAKHVRASDMDRPVTTRMAASVAGMATSTIRSWVHRGHLEASDRNGRTPLYRLADVVAVARRDPYRPRTKPMFRRRPKIRS